MSQWKSETEGEDDVQMPLNTGDAGGGEEYVSAAKPRINTSTMALFAAFAAALVVLYLLGLQNKPRAASAEAQARQQAVTSAIDEMLKTKDGTKVETLLGDIPRLVKILREYLGSKNEETFDLPSNPFEREEAVAAASKDPVTLIPTDTSEAQRTRRLAEEFGKLKLQTIMFGRNPVAMIDNQMVTEGGKCRGFVVSKIERDRVLLSDGKNTYEKKLSSPKMGEPE